MHDAGVKNAFNPQGRNPTTRFVVCAASSVAYMTRSLTHPPQNSHVPSCGRHGRKLMTNGGTADDDLRLPAYRRPRRNESGQVCPLKIGRMRKDIPRENHRHHAAGHMVDVDGPLFRPVKHNGKQLEKRRPMDPDAIDRVVRKYPVDNVKCVGWKRGGR